MFTIQESIRPSADLRNHYAEISKSCKENKERIELLEVLAEAEEDVKKDRVAPITETFDDLRKMLQEE